MAKRSFNLQVPADVRSLVALCHKLGYTCGPIVNAQIDGDQKINIWFQVVPGATEVKRASARLVKGVVEIRDGSHRRVYLDLKLQSPRGFWKEIRHNEFEAKGLEPPYQYDGPCHIAVYLHVGRCDGEWEDTGTGLVVNASYSIPYFRHLEGDRKHAIAEAQKAIDELRASRPDEQDEGSY
jgi:hypothetical protein